MRWTSRFLRRCPPAIASRSPRLWRCWRRRWTVSRMRVRPSPPSRSRAADALEGFSLRDDLFVEGIFGKWPDPFQAYYTVTIHQKALRHAIDAPIDRRSPIGIATHRGEGNAKGHQEPAGILGIVLV